jgi:hypothetical protein
VVDEDDLVGAEQPLRDDQRANCVVGGDAAGVADDVRLALLEAEYVVDVQAGIHARQHSDMLGGRERKIALRERLGIGLVVA